MWSTLALAVAMCCLTHSTSAQLLALNPEQRPFVDALKAITAVPNQFECGTGIQCNFSGFIIDANIHSLHGALPTNASIWQLVAPSLTGLSLAGLPPLDATIDAIPTEIGLLTNLELLSFTRVSGVLPSQIGLLTRMSTLVIRSSSVSGAIPHEIFSNLLQLRTVVFDAPLSGQLPAALFDRTFVTCELSERTESACFVDIVCPQSCRCQPASLGCAQSTATLPPFIPPTAGDDTTDDNEYPPGIWVGIAAGVLGLICMAIGLVLCVSTRRADAEFKQSMLKRQQQQQQSSSSASNASRSYPTPTTVSSTSDGTELVKRPSKKRSSRRRVHEPNASSTGASPATQTGYVDVPAVRTPTIKTKPKSEPAQQQYVGFEPLPSSSQSQEPASSQYGDLSLGPVYHAPPVGKTLESD